MFPTIIIYDCDLRSVDGAIEVIKVWHESFDNPMQLDKICGHDFYLRWLPAEIRDRYTCLEDYWDTNPYTRNQAVTEYLLDRMGVFKNREAKTF